MKGLLVHQCFARVLFHLLGIDLLLRLLDITVLFQDVVDLFFNLLVTRLNLLLIGNRAEGEKVFHPLLRLIGNFLFQLLFVFLHLLEVLIKRNAQLLLYVLLHLVKHALLFPFDQHIRYFHLRLFGNVFQNFLAEPLTFLRFFFGLHAFTDILLQPVQAVEITDLLGELVVNFRRFHLVDLAHFHVERHLLAGQFLHVVLFGNLCGEFRFLAGGHARQRFLKTGQ